MSSRRRKSQPRRGWRRKIIMRDLRAAIGAGSLGSYRERVLAGAAP